MKKTLTQRKKRGQGMIEYAGAMVISAIIVSAVMPVATTGMTNLYATIFNQFQVYVASQMARLNTNSVVTITVQS